MSVTSDLNRRFVAAFMALVFAISCMVIGVNFSTKADTQGANLTPEATTDNGMNLKKYLTVNSKGTYDLNLEAYATGQMQSETEMTPMDIVMVMDQSANMGTADMNPTYTATDSKNWTVNDATGSGTTYFYKVGNNYYEVKAEEGTIYEAVDDAPHIYQMIGRGHDDVSLGANGSPIHYNVPTNYYALDSNDKIHKVWVITAGDFLDYSAWAYYYTNNTGAKEIVTGTSGLISKSLVKSNVLVNEENPYNNGKEWTENIYWVGTSLDQDDFFKSNENVIKNHYSSDYVCNATVFNGSYIWRSLAANGQVCIVGRNGATRSDMDATQLTYSWISNGSSVNNLYLPKDGVNYNKLYYVNDSGNKVYIGNEVDVESATAYSGVLYTVTGQSRVSVLQSAATQFINAVKENAEENGVDHRIAIVGFAGNKFPTESSGTTAYNTTKYDYTNTGLFIDGSFVNYETLQTMSSTSNRYINSHYYTSGTVTNGIPSGDPVTYSGGSWYRLGTSTKYTGTFYEPTYQELTVMNYKNALETVTDSTDYGYLQTAINNLAHYGGSYTSYGMTMANNVFENNTKTYTDSEGETQQRARVIVVFTCGEPGGNGYSSSIAGEALVDGNRAKYTIDSGGYDASVYTIGLFPGNASTETETFMRQLSSQYTIPVSNKYGATTRTSNNNWGCGELDPDTTYYYTDTDGKTYAVTTQYKGLSSLGWWSVVESNGSKTYYHRYPKTGSSDARTIDGTSVITFYTSSNGSGAIYEEDLVPGTTYYTSDGVAINYEYRWYNSNNKVREPKTSSSDTGTNRWQFFGLGTPTEDTSGTYYYDVKNEAATLQAFAAAFEQIKTTHEKTIASVTLDGTSILRDVINTTNFELPSNPSNATTVKVYDGSIASGATEPSGWTEDSSIKPTPTWSDNTLNVTGFDYAANYIAQGHAGKKIVVTVSGLKPKTTGDILPSNSSAKIVYNDDDIASFPEPAISRHSYKLAADRGTYSALFTIIDKASETPVPAENLENVVIQNGDTRQKLNSNQATWTSVGNDTVMYLENLPAGAVVRTNITADDNSGSYTYTLTSTEDSTTTSQVFGTDFNVGYKDVTYNVTSTANNTTLSIKETVSGNYSSTSATFDVTLTLTPPVSANWGDTVTLGSYTATKQADGTYTLVISDISGDGNAISIPDMPIGTMVKVASTPDIAYYNTGTITYTLNSGSSTNYDSATGINVTGATDITIPNTADNIPIEGVSDTINPISMVLLVLAGICVAGAVVAVVVTRKKKIT